MGINDMPGDARHGERAAAGHRDTPTRLPFELLHAIFLLAATPATSPHGPQHGGSVRSWHSYEAAAPYALVCRAWRKPAQAVLFSSVALVGHRRALAFVEAASLPSFVALTSKTASVVLALDAAAEGTADDSHGQLETSELLVTALEHCSAASHVCIRPLHQGVRDRLLATLMSPERTLVTLILRPRTFASVNWTGQLWHASDALQLRPTVQNLEHTTLMTPYPTPPDSATSSPRASYAAEHAPLFDKLALRRVKVWYDFPGKVLAEAFLRSPQLEYLDLYFERRKPTDLFVRALMASAHSLREIRYIYNPTSPESDHEGSSPSRSSTSSSSESADRPLALFDQLLPHLPALTSLRCSATDLTPSALHALPPSLTRLAVRSLDPQRSRFTPLALVAALSRADLALPPAFEQLVVVDSPDAGWSDAVIERVSALCGARGVGFEFRLDFEHEGADESSVSGWSGEDAREGHRRSSGEGTAETREGSGPRSSQSG